MSMVTNLRREALVSGRGEGRPVHVLGADLTIKISSRDTNGAFAVFEGCTPPLEGPPLHRHRDHDEWWYIVEGEYRFEVDGEEIYASAGRYRLCAARQPAHVPECGKGPRPDDRHLSPRWFGPVF